MACEEDEGEGKLPSVDHGRRTDRGRDKKYIQTHDLIQCCSQLVVVIGLFRTQTESESKLDSPMVVV
jgi:hypothetical protein